jgi:hypothetical protein
VISNTNYKEEKNNILLNDQETFVILWFALLFAFQLLAKKNYSQLSWKNESRFII